MRWPLLCGAAGAGAGQHRARLVGAAMKDDSDVLLDARRSVRAAVAARVRRRQRGGAGNPPAGGRGPRLDDRAAIRRHVRDLAGGAGPERDDRDADRLSRRGILRRAGHDARDVRADRVLAAYFSRIWDRFATRHGGSRPGRTGSGFGRTGRRPARSCSPALPVTTGSAVGITAATAAIALLHPLNPLWLFGIAQSAGFAGLV